MAMHTALRLTGRIAKSIVTTTLLMVTTIIVCSFCGLIGWLLGTWFIGVGMPPNPNEAARNLQTIVGTFTCGVAVGMSMLGMAIAWSELESQHN